MGLVTLLGRPIRSFSSVLALAFRWEIEVSGAGDEGGDDEDEEVEDEEDEETEEVVAEYVWQDH